MTSISKMKRNSRAKVKVKVDYECKFKICTNWGINIFKYHVVALMGRFQLELIYLPSNSRLFLSCRSFVVITTFSTVDISTAQARRQK